MSHPDSFSPDWQADKIPSADIRLGPKPIRKSEVQSRDNEEVQLIVDREVSDINRKLKAGQNNHTSPCGRHKETVINILIKIYSEAGWKVKRENGSDQRDGSWDYLTFS